MQRITHVGLEKTDSFCTGGLHLALQLLIHRAYRGCLPTVLGMQKQARAACSHSTKGKQHRIRTPEGYVQNPTSEVMQTSWHEGSFPFYCQHYPIPLLSSSTNCSPTKHARLKIFGARNSLGSEGLRQLSSDLMDTRIWSEAASVRGWCPFPSAPSAFGQSGSGTTDCRTGYPVTPRAQFHPLVIEGKRLEPPACREKSMSFGAAASASLSTVKEG